MTVHALNDTGSPSGNGAALQALLNAGAVNYGDTIVLQASIMFQNATEFVVGQPGGSVSNGYVTVQSSALSSLPAVDPNQTNLATGASPQPTQPWIGRVSPNHTTDPASNSLMPKTGIPSAQYFMNSPIMSFAQGANYWRFRGIEFVLSDTTVTPAFSSGGTNYPAGGKQGYWLIRCDGATSQNGDVAASSAAQQPDHIWFDQCYIHAAFAHVVCHGVYAHAVGTLFVTNCYIANIRGASGMYGSNGEAHCLSIVGGTGPVHVINCYLEATGQSAIFGGDVPTYDAVPSGSFYYNTMTKNLQWNPLYSGYVAPPVGIWICKNNLEFKTGQNIIVDHNFLQYSWYNEQSDGQQGGSLLFNLNSYGGEGIERVQNITITNNVLDSVCRAFDWAEEAGSGALTANQIITNIICRNNLITNLGWALGWAWPGRPADTNPDSEPMATWVTRFATFDHNTFITATTGVVRRILECPGSPGMPGFPAGPNNACAGASTNLVITNNIYDEGNDAPGYAANDPNSSSSTYGDLVSNNITVLNEVNPGAVIRNNVIYNATSSTPNIFADHPVLGSAGAVGFSASAPTISYYAANGQQVTLPTYPLGGSSAYKGAGINSSGASDGSDIGCNCALLQYGSGITSLISTTTTGSSSGGAAGSSVTFTSTVTGASAGAAAPSGTVLASLAGSSVGVGTLTGSGATSTASFSVSGLPAGTDTVTLNYSGDATYAASSANATAVMTGGTTINTTIQILHSGVAQTSPFTIPIPSPGQDSGTNIDVANVTMTPASGTLSASAAVVTMNWSLGVDTFPSSTHSQAVGSTMTQSGAAVTTQFNLDPLAWADNSHSSNQSTPPLGFPGNYLVSAQFAAQGSFTSSSSSPFNLIVGVKTTCTLSNPGSTLTPNQSYTVTATLTAADSSTVTGPVVFSLTNTGTSTTTQTTATAAVGSASYTFSLPSGSYGLGATFYAYQPDPVNNPGRWAGCQSNELGFTVSSVNPTATTSVLSLPQQFSLLDTVTAADHTSPTGNVVFSWTGASSGNTTVALSAGSMQSTASLNLTTFAAGTYAFTAAYAAQGTYAASTSNSQAFTMSSSPAATTNNLIFNADYTVTDTVMLSATGGGAVTGNVVLSYTGAITGAGSTTLALTAGSASSSASFSLASLAADSYTMTSTYVGTSNYAASTASQQPNFTIIGDGVTIQNPPVQLYAGSLYATVNVSVNTNDNSFAVGILTLTTTGYSQSVTLSGGQRSATFSLQTLAAGTYTLSANFAGSGGYANAGPTTRSVNLAGALEFTSTTLSAPAQMTVNQASATATVSVHAGSGTPTGILALTASPGPQLAQNLSTLTQSGGVTTAAFALAALSLAAGNYTLTGSYSGDNAFAASVSAAQSFIVSATAPTMITTTTSLAGTPTAIYPGQNAVATLTVAASDSSTPTGAVTLTISPPGPVGPTLTQTLASGASSATFTLAGLSAGMYQLTGNYLGQGNYLASTSMPLAVTVALTLTVVNVSAPSPIQPGSATATVTVTAQDGSNLAGDTVYLQATGTLGSSQNLTQTLSGPFNTSTFTLNLVADTYNLISTFPQQGHYAAKASSVTSLLVESAAPPPPTGGASVTIPVVDVPWGTPAQVPVFVQSVSFPPPTGTVTMQVNGISYGGPVTLQGGTAFFQIAPVGGAGIYTLTANYSGDSNYGASSGAGSLVVTEATVSVNIAAPRITYGQSGLITVRVIANPASYASPPAGSVSVTVDGSTVASGTLDNTGSFVATAPTLAAGAHAITVVYAGSTNYQGATASGSIAVMPAPTQTSISAPASVTVGTGTATVTVTSAAGTPTGNVVVQGNTTLALVSGSVSFSLSALPTGSNALRAVYPAQGNFAFSQGSQTIQVRTGAPYITTSVVILAQPITAGQAASVTVTVGGYAGTGGTVSFSVDGGIVQQATLNSGGVATFSINGLAHGSHELVVSFSGNAMCLPSGNAGYIVVN